MHLIGLMLIRNARWIIGASARAALSYCDEIVVMDHCSEDRTGDILLAVAAEFPGRVTVITEHSESFDEMDYRERLLVTAREHGATHVANIDDDEVMTAPAARVVREFAERLLPGRGLKMPAPRIWGGLDAVQVETSSYTEPIADVIFALDVDTTYCARSDGYQFHARRPKGITSTVAMPREYGGQMHLQTVSLRRFLAKQAWYKMVELLRWPGRGVNKINSTYDATVYGAQREFKLRLAPPTWWEGMEKVRAAIDWASEPWQEADARRMWQEHGPAKFAGLDLYGVVGDPPVS